MEKSASQHIHVVLLLLIAGLSGCRQSPAILAEVGRHTITCADYSTRYEGLRRKLGLPDNGQVRMQILEEMVDDELLMAAAGERGMDRDAPARHELERLHLQALLDRFEEEHVGKRVHVREAELRDYFLRFNTRLRARHLYAASRHSADSLHALLLQGCSFTSLARSTFNDSRLRETGGDLGWFSVDEMDPAFENAAFALRPGEISPPVRTAQGYSIIQLQDRVTTPLLSETAYAQKRPGLLQYAALRQRKERARALSDSLRQALQITFNPVVLRQLWSAIRARSSGQAEMLLPDTLAALDPQEIACSSAGPWSVQTLRERAAFTTEEQLQWVHNPENLQDWIAGLMIRDHMLALARQEGLDRQEACRVAIERKTGEYLIRRMTSALEAETVVPEDSLRALFARDTARWALPPRIHLAEIALPDAATARDAARQLRGGADFAALALQLSVRRWSAEQLGDIGSFTRQELGAWADELFGLQLGQWCGPVRIDSLFILFKCLGREHDRPRSYDQARSDIDKSLRPFFQRAHTKEFLAKRRSVTRIRLFADRVRKLSI
ncbi:MAG TPA: peptidylprolyl isomerase [bacterium]|nr:peptidylprolyl isomerase [bacterium]